MDNFENFKSTYFMNFNPNVSLSEEHIKSNLDDMMNSCEILNNKLRTIEDTYTNYCLLIKKPPTDADLEIIHKMRKSLLDLKKQSNPSSQQKIIQHRVKHDLEEFIIKFGSVINRELLKNLKSL